MTTQRQPKNYLNNRDMLREIHLSKNTYCSYVRPEYHRYDYIVDYQPTESIEKNLEYLSKSSTIQAAREERAARIYSETRVRVDPSTIDVGDLIFRVMTWDHIPLSPKLPKKQEKKKSARELFELELFDDDDSYGDLEDNTTAKEVDDHVHVRLNFPPFQHYKFNSVGTLVCIGKSHWRGDIFAEDGFSKDHGNVTNNLARMYIEMCNRYATKYNWRGYTYNDEMRGAAILQLTYVGLRFNEAKSQNPFAYYTAAITNSFCRVLNVEKKNQNIRDDILVMNNLNPSWTRQNSEVK